MNLLFIKNDTTGYDKNDEVLKVNIIEVKQNEDGNTVRKEDSFKVCPLYRDTWDSAASVHNIFPEDVNAFNTMDAFYGTLRQKMNEADVIIGTSLGFEFRMLAQSGFIVPDTDKYVDIAKVHAQRMAVGEFGDDGYQVDLTKRYGLSALCEKYDVYYISPAGTFAVNSVEDVYCKEKEKADEFRGIASCKPSSLKELGIDFQELLDARNLRYLKDDNMDITDEEANIFPSYMSKRTRLQKYGELVSDVHMTREDIKDKVVKSCINEIEAYPVKNTGRLLVSYVLDDRRMFKIFNKEFLDSYVAWKNSSVKNESFDTSKLEGVRASGGEYDALKETERQQILADLLGASRKIPAQDMCSDHFQKLVQSMLVTVRSIGKETGQCPEALSLDLKKWDDTINLYMDERSLRQEVSEGVSVPITNAVSTEKNNWVFPVDMLTMMHFPKSINLELEKDCREWWKEASMPSHSMLPFVLDDEKKCKPFTMTTLFSGSEGNVTILDTGTQKYMIDAGVPFTTKLLPALKKAKIDPKEIKGVFITHEHIDHIYAVPQILKKLDCPVYASEGTWDKIRDRFSSLTSEKAYVMPQRLYLTDNLVVDKVATVHDVKEPNGYLFERNGYSALYVTDTGKVTKEMEQAIQKANAVVLESNHDIDLLAKNENYSNSLKWRIVSDRGHLSNEQACKALEQCHADTVSLAHLSKENNTLLHAMNAVETAFDNKKIDDAISFVYLKQDNLDLEKETSKKQKRQISLLK